MMVPVTQEHASFATMLLARFDHPVHESLTVLIVQETVGFESKVYVSEYYGFAEKVAQNFIPLFSMCSIILSTNC